MSNENESKKKSEMLDGEFTIKGEELPTKEIPGLDGLPPEILEMIALAASKGAKVHVMCPEKPTEPTEPSQKLTMTYGSGRPMSLDQIKRYNRAKFEREIADIAQKEGQPPHAVKALLIAGVLRQFSAVVKEAYIDLITTLVFAEDPKVMEYLEEMAKRMPAGGECIVEVNRKMLEVVEVVAQTYSEIKKITYDSTKGAK